MDNGEDRVERVLLALCGLSPAVVTETVWALAQEGRAPAEVVAITTVEGRDCILRDLLDTGIFDELRVRLGLDPLCLRFGRSTHSIRVVPMADRGGDLSDVDSGEASAEFGDAVLGILREFIERPDTEVVLSIAGGRKSMSAIALQCLSLLARPRDRACHVLVSAPFDDPRMLPRFFFPSETRHRAADGVEHRGGEARIVLHDIPFIRCREVFVREHASLPGTFKATVDLVNRAIEPPHLVLRRKDRVAAVRKDEIELTDIQFMILHCLAVSPERVFRSDELAKCLETFRKEHEYLNVLSDIGMDWVRHRYSELKKCLPAGILRETRGKYGLLLPGDRIVLG